MKEIQPLHHVNIGVLLLRGHSSSLVWAWWVLQFPSSGCAVCQLLCLVYTRDDLTHHESTEMSQDLKFGIYGGTVSCRARSETGSGGTG